MNSFTTALIKRRSIRKFKLEQIQEDELQDILNAGLHAMNAANFQYTKFIVVQNSELSKKLSVLNLKMLMKGDFDPYHNAPTIVLIMSKIDYPCAKEDGALAAGNMANAAFAMGIGSCWIHRENEMFENEDGKELLKQFGVEEELQGVGALVLGYPDEEKKPSDRYNPDRIHRERW